MKKVTLDDLIADVKNNPKKYIGSVVLDVNGMKHLVVGADKNGFVTVPLIKKIGVGE